MSGSRHFCTTSAIAMVMSLQSMAASGQAMSRADVSGKWQLTVETSAGTGSPTMTLKQSGDSITGHYSSAVLGEADVKGSIKGEAITLKLNVEVQGTALVVTYAGIVTGDTMKGTVDLGGEANGTFTGKRQ
jgi:hypothetical protein